MNIFAFLGIALLVFTASSTDALRIAFPPPKISCATMRCLPDHRCVDKPSPPRCVKNELYTDVTPLTKPGQCPPLGCPMPSTPCSTTPQCTADGDCPGDQKCCWWCDNCNRCMSPFTPGR